MQYTNEQIAELRDAWAKVYENDARGVVLPIEAIRYLPELSEYNGDAVIILVPQAKINAELLEKIKAAVNTINPPLPVFTGSKVE